MRIYGRQIAAARVLVGLSQAELAAATNLSIQTVRRMEASPGEATGLTNNLNALQAFLESVGIAFIREQSAFGVKFTPPGSSQVVPEE